MALREQVVSIRFGAGIDAGTDPKQVTQALHKLQDGVFDKAGSISSRAGMVDATATETVTRLATLSGRAVTYSQDRIAQHDGGSPDTGDYAATRAIDGWTDDIADTRIGFYDIETSRPRALSGKSDPRDVETLAYGNVRLVSCVTSSTGRLYVLNRFTGATLATMDTHYETSPDSPKPNALRLLMVNSQIFVFWPADTGTGQYLHWVTVDEDDGTISSVNVLSGITLDGLEDLKAVWDVCDISTGGNTAFMVAAATDDSSDKKVIVANYVIGMGGSFSLTSALAAKPHAITITPLSSSEVLVVYAVESSNVTTIYARTFDPSDASTVSTSASKNAAIVTGFTVSAVYVFNQIAVVRTSDTRAVLYWTSYMFLSGTDGSSANFGRHCVARAEFTSTGGTGAITTPTALIPGGMVASQPFLDDDSRILFFATSFGSHITEGDSDLSRLQTLVLVHDPDVDGLTWNPVGRALTDSFWFKWSAAEYGNGFHHQLPRPFAEGADGHDFLTAGWSIGALERVDATGAERGVVIVRAVLSGAIDHAQAVDAGGGQLLLSGGVTFDGAEAVEQGFFSSPSIYAITVDSGTTEPGSGSYGFIATYYWKDASGNVHESAPSTVYSRSLNATLGGVDTVTVQGPMTKRILPQPFPKSYSTQPTDADTLCAVRLYRTVADGSIYYLVASKPPDEDDAEIGLVFFNDDDGVNLDDDDLISRAQIYTTGAASEALPNEQPASYRVHAIHQDRHFIVPTEHAETRVNYSKTIIPGVAVSYSSLLTIPVDHAGGEITALASYQEKLIIFKESAIYATHGTGLSDAGTGQGYTEPYILAKGIGCTNPQSIVETPQGLLFQAQQGIHSIDRGMNVSPVGTSVDYWTQDSGLVISAAAAIPKDDIVVFLSNSSSKPSLVHHYAQGQWGTYSNVYGTDAIAAYDRLVVARSSGVVLEDTTAEEDETGTGPRLVVTTGWLSLADLGGFLRFRRGALIGQWMDASAIRIRIAYDFDPNWTDDVNIDTSGSHQLTSFDYGAYFEGTYNSTYDDSAMVLEFSGSRQKCTAVRFEISHYSLGDEQGIRLNGIALVVAGKGGLKRLGDGRQVGPGTLPT